MESERIIVFFLSVFALLCLGCCVDFISSWSLLLPGAKCGVGLVASLGHDSVGARAMQPPPGACPLVSLSVAADGDALFVSRKRSLRALFFVRSFVHGNISKHKSARFGSGLPL